MKKREQGATCEYTLQKDKVKDLMNYKKLFGLFLAFIGLTLVMYNLSTGKQPAKNGANEQHGTLLHGIVIDAGTGQPIPGARINIPLVNRRHQTGEGGRYSFENLNAGSYKVETSHQPYKTNTASVAMLDQEKRHVIKLEPNGDKRTRSNNN